MLSKIVGKGDWGIVGFSYEDIATTGAGIGAFAFFFALQCIVFRFIKAEQLFKGLMLTFAAGLAAALSAACVLFPEGPVPGRVGYAALICIIYGAACFFYVLWFFGPSETSIRIRLVRELALAKEGYVLAELLSKYNTAVILDKRLKRLLGSGDIAREGDRYFVRKKSNVFLVIDAVARKMHAFIHSR